MVERKNATGIPGIKDVAKRANVSISTVSNAIRGSKNVSAELRERIQDAIDTLGYQADPFASGLKSRLTNTVGIVVTDVHRIFFPRVIRGVQDGLATRQINLNLFDTKDCLEKEKGHIEQMRNYCVDGILLDSVADYSDVEYLRSLASLNNRGKHIPVVSLERRFAEYNMDSVSVSNRKGGFLAAEHLIGKGCRNLVFISGPENSCMVRDRLAGCRDALVRLGGGEIQLQVLEGDFSPMAGYQAIREYMERNGKVDGIFAANDQMGVGAMKALKEMGKRIPEEVKVVGFDNSFVASLVSPTLTTVHVSKYQLGRTAAELLLDRLEKPDNSARLIELPVNLVVRQSTDLRGESAWDLLAW